MPDIGPFPQTHMHVHETPRLTSAHYRHLLTPIASLAPPLSPVCGPAPIHKENP
jgi:hypothetical protein